MAMRVMMEAAVAETGERMAMPIMKRRTVLHLTVTKRRTRCLPVVLHLMDGHLEWFNQVCFAGRLRMRA